MGDIHECLLDVDNGFGNVWVWSQLVERCQQIADDGLVSQPKKEPHAAVSKTCFVEFCGETVGEDWLSIVLKPLLVSLVSFCLCSFDKGLQIKVWTG